MKTIANSKAFILLGHKRSKVMQPQTRFGLMEPVFRILFILFSILALSSCASGDRANSSPCSLEKVVTIEATDARPMKVFDQLSNELNCRITVYPFVWHRVTVHMQDATAGQVIAAVCEQIDCKYTLNGQHLSIAPLMTWEKRNIQAQEEWQAKFELRMPQGMSYEAATVSRVLADISEVSGLEIAPWEGEGLQKVSVDISGLTVDEALKAVVLQIEDCEGVVLVEGWDGHSTAQHRLVDKP